MGWVRQKIEDRRITGESVTPLWNSLRDSIGAALAEFKASVSQPAIEHSDCAARGSLCVRVRKPGRFIEIFISSSDQSVKLASSGVTVDGAPEDQQPRIIALYLLNDARSDLEFRTSSNAPASADEVAREALESFLFDPFPTFIRQ